MPLPLPFQRTPDNEDVNPDTLAESKLPCFVLLPKRIKVDNGPEFILRALDEWAYFNNVKLDYSDQSPPITPA